MESPYECNDVYEICVKFINMVIPYPSSNFYNCVLPGKLTPFLLEHFPCQRNQLCDIFVTGILVSGCLPVFHQSQLKGVACIDRTVSDLLSDVTYFNKGELNYAFVLDGEARVLTHPLLPRPQTIRDDPVFTRLTSLERSPHARDVMTSMIR